MKGSVVKKGNVYYCVYRVNGKQKWVKGGKTKSQANKKLIEILGEINDGTYREIKDIGFIEEQFDMVQRNENYLLPPQTLTDFGDLDDIQL